jgi:hypothetical protein
MAFSITLQELPGYKTAKALYNKLPGKGKLKKFLVGALVAGTIITGISLGIIGVFGLIAFGGWLLTLPLLLALGVIASLTAVLFFVISAINYVWNFNWAISDTEIEAQIKESFNIFYGLLGETMGKSVGYLVCGGLPGSLAFAFNPAVAAVIMKDLTTEAQQELIGEIANLARTVLGTFANALFLKGFKSARKWIKRPGSPMHDVLKKAMGKKNFEEWGKRQGNQYTLSGQVDQRVEQIKDPRLRNFTREFLQGFSQGCLSGMSIVTNNVDAYMAASRLMREESVVATTNVVRVTTNSP